MAPVAASNEITDLNLSSLELDARSTTLNHLLSRSLPESLLKRNDVSQLSSPTEVYHTLTARDGIITKAADHGGAVDPTDINMKGVQALFALIGASFVLGIIWFFFWAKNGGFKWRKGDWDDYKSTVLRRKGPNGTTLSNATKSTILGGGSVVGEGFSDSHGSVTDGTATEYMTDTMTDMGSDAPIVREKRKKETAKERKIREVKEADWEGANDNDVRAYMKEKPARVGGINKDSEAFHYGTDYSNTEGSQIHNINPNRQSRAAGPRGSSSRQGSPEKRQSRRDFSFTNEDAFSTISTPVSEIPAPPLATAVNYPEPAAPPPPPHRPGRYHSPSKQYTQPQYQSQPQPQPQPQPSQHDNRPTGQWTRPNGQTSYHEGSVVSEIQSQNTKSYHHPLPSLSNQQNRPTGGYRRDRRDSFE